MTEWILAPVAAGRPCAATRDGAKAGTGSTLPGPAHTAK